MIKRDNKSVAEAADPLKNEFDGMLTPSDVVYDLHGYLWPIIKKYQYSYTTNGREVKFDVPGHALDVKRVSRSDLDKIRAAYLAQGWDKCTISMYGHPSSTAIEVVLTQSSQQKKNSEK